MRLCIITNDKIIIKDGEGYSGLDVSYIPTTVHAFQWYETYGEIEYKNTELGIKPPNENITSFPDWVNSALTVWDTAKTAEAARIQAAIASAQEQQAINDTQAETITALTARIVALESRT